MAYGRQSLPVDGYMTIDLTNSANRTACELRRITTCIEFNEIGKEIINGMTSYIQGFSYSYVNQNLPVLHNAMVDYPTGCSNIEQTVIAEMVSFTAFSDTGMRHYKSVDNQTHFSTTWNPSNTNVPQVSATVMTNPSSGPNPILTSLHHFNNRAFKSL